MLFSYCGWIIIPETVINESYLIRFSQEEFIRRIAWFKVRVKDMIIWKSTEIWYSSCRHRLLHKEKSSVKTQHLCTFNPIALSRLQLWKLGQWSFTSETMEAPVSSCGRHTRLSSLWRQCQNQVATSNSVHWSQRRSALSLHLSYWLAGGKLHWL